MVVSPDAGGVERARAYAKRLQASLAIIDKRRPKPGVAEVMNIIGEVKDKRAIIIDDMIDTGGTLVKACETLLEEKAKRVIACAVHPVFSGNAIERLHASPLEEVIVTDTIPIQKSDFGEKITVLSVAPLFAEAIHRIHNEDSVSSLFK